MNTQKKQLGSTLAISLVILTAVTIVSVTAMQRSGLQTRMVGNIQQLALGFNISDGEQANIYDFYSSQSSATEALSAPQDNYKKNSQLGKIDKNTGKEIEDENGGALEVVTKEYAPTPTGHTSAYTDYQGSSSKYPRVAVSSDILYLDQVNTLVEGFSIGTFVEHGFKTTTVTSNPISGKELSSQSTGINYIAPAPANAGNI